TATASSVNINLGGEKYIVCHAVNLFGSHNRVWNVHAYNGYGTVYNGIEAFTIRFATPVIGGFDAFDNVGGPNIICDQQYGNYGAPFTLQADQYTPQRSMHSSGFIFNKAFGWNDGYANGYTSGGVNAGEVFDCYALNNY